MVAQASAGQKSHTLRRSVALPEQPVKEAIRNAPGDIGDNFNRLVATALKEYIARRKAIAFEEAMARMAADPAIQAEDRRIALEFATADMDGLKDDYGNRREDARSS